MTKTFKNFSTKDWLMVAAGSLVVIGIAGAVYSLYLSGPKVYSGTAVIEMTADGFVPPVIYVKKGTNVSFKNTDTLWHWPASDLHPTHTLYPEFDPKRAIAPGEAWSFTFEKTGAWGSHDHLAPYVTGKIIVVE